MRKILLFSALFIFAASTMLQAQMRDCPGPMGSGMKHHGPGYGEFGLMQCKEELNLTDEQVGKIKDINFEFHSQMIDFKAELEKLQLSKRHEMQSENPDKGEILMLTKEINSIRGQIAEAKVEQRFALRGILSKEQLDKWQECRPGCGSRCGDEPGFRRSEQGHNRSLKERGHR